MADTLTRTMAICAADTGIGGASTTLTIHNREETFITQLGNAVYLNELYLARSFTGAAAANDCQSGPSAAFRFCAVSGVARLVQTKCARPLDGRFIFHCIFPC